MSRWPYGEPNRTEGYSATTVCTNNLPNPARVIRFLDGTWYMIDERGVCTSDGKYLAAITPFDRVVASAVSIEVNGRVIIASKAPSHVAAIAPHIGAAPMAMPQKLEAQPKIVAPRLSWLLTLTWKAQEHNGDDGFQCTVCEEKRRDTALQPCGHTSSCVDCLRQLAVAGLSGADPFCPVCREKISGAAHVFL